MKKRYLILEDGTIFQGWAFGADETVIGELVFNTSVVGYVETLTDPCYYGQIVMQTFPLVGNYGIMEADFQGKPALKGYVVKECCKIPSNFRCEYDLDIYLKNNNIPGLYGVDTRELTNRIREYGVVNAMITDKLPEDFDEIVSYAITGAVEATTCKDTAVYPAEGEEQAHVVVIDCGFSGTIVKALTARGCRVTVVPAPTSADEVLALEPNGIVLSAGPGDPTENVGMIETVKALIGKKPIFGYGLGHQLLALAMGGRTVKMKHGHRGGNQPCRKVGTRRTYITSQNHGYAVSGPVPGGVESFVNVNDGSNAGMEYPEAKAFSVQFEPDSCTFGAKNTNELYDKFLTMMKEG